MSDKEIADRLSRMDPETAIFLLGVACRTADENTSLSFFDVWRRIFKVQNPHD